MKTKNILKIGVFSILLFTLLISPILKSNILEAAVPETLRVQKAIEFAEISIQVGEEPAADACEGIGVPDTAWNLVANFPKWWEHKVCLFQVGVIEGLGKMFAGMINYQIGMILWAFNPETYGGFVYNDAVQAIWGFIRDLINLVLVLALVIIAVMTILRVKKYAWQNTLWKLIIVALLINFSLVIAGIILDISNFLSYYFLNLAKINNQNVAESMMSSFDTEKLSGTEKYKLSLVEDVDISSKKPGTTALDVTEKKGWGLSWGNFFLAALSLILVGGFAFIALLAICVAMFIRSFIILALLCVSSAAFAAWVFPDTERFWKMWWGQFIKWCLFPIIFSLMLYIGIYAVNNLVISGQNGDLGMIAFFVRIVLFSMFLVGGLIFSIQGSGAASQLTLKQASKVGLAAGALAGIKTKEKITESPTYKKAGQALTGIPLLRGVGQEMMVAGEKAKAARVKEHEKNLENVSLGTLKQLEKAPLPSPLDRNAHERRIALDNKLADMGELGKESIEHIRFNKGDTRLNVKAISEAIPHYFKFDDKGRLIETGDTIENKVEALSRIKPDKIRDKTQTSDFIKNIVGERKAEAEKQGKSVQEIKDAEDKTFEEIIQETVKKLSPAQLAGWWQGISPKDMVKEGWGSPEGKIVQAIEKDPIAKKKFYDEAIPSSTILRAASGVTMEKSKNDKGKDSTDPYEQKDGGRIFTKK